MCKRQLILTLNLSLYFNLATTGEVWWCTTAPSTGEAKARRLRVQGQPGIHSENLLKERERVRIKTLSSYRDSLKYPTFHIPLGSICMH
jgi:hypothetical protein